MMKGKDNHLLLVVGTMLMLVVIIGIFYTTGYFVTRENECGKWVEINENTNRLSECSDELMDHVRITAVGIFMCLIVALACTLIYALIWVCFETTRFILSWFNLYEYPEYKDDDENEDQ